MDNANKKISEHIESGIVSQAEGKYDIYFYFERPKRGFMKEFHSVPKNLTAIELHIDKVLSGPFKCQIVLPGQENLQQLSGVAHGIIGRMPNPMSLPGPGSDSGNQLDPMMTTAFTTNFSYAILAVSYFLHNVPDRKLPGETLMDDEVGKHKLEALDRVTSTLTRYTSTVAELLDQLYDELLDKQQGDNVACSRFTAQLLWVEWQRMVTLLRYLDLGFMNVQNYRLAKVTMSALVQMKIPRYARKGIDRLCSEIPPEVCPGTFRALVKQGSFFGHNFKTFFKRCPQRQHDRCSEPRQECNGEHRNENQKQHQHDDNFCKRGRKYNRQGKRSSWKYKGCGCRKRKWDKEDYKKKSEQGSGCAVDITRQHLGYCPANKRTLAISHVWSHGQGGRPDPGINECLHKRYVEIAQKNRCTSYWIDTTSIPEEHGLRIGAIATINPVFRNSKITLACDEDIMALDKPASVEDQEKLLAALSVCDWSTRAWTLLEGYMGAHNLHFLCRRNEIVSFMEIACSVYHYGCIDLALLLVTMPHLFPSALSRPSSSRLDTCHAIVVTGHLLVSRYASRKDDEFTIWSLLCDDKPPAMNAQDFWCRRLRNSEVDQSLLISHAPRLEEPSWAPKEFAGYELLADIGFNRFEFHYTVSRVKTLAVIEAVDRRKLSSLLFSGKRIFLQPKDPGEDGEEMEEGEYVEKLGFRHPVSQTKTGALKVDAEKTSRAFYTKWKARKMYIDRRKFPSLKKFSGKHVVLLRPKGPGEHSEEIEEGQHVAVCTYEGGAWQWRRVICAGADLRETELKVEILGLA